MHVIQCLDDIQRLTHLLSDEKELLRHIEKSLEELRQALEPENNLAEFKLGQYGLIAILEREDELLRQMGCDYVLEDAWPDFVECHKFDETIYYKVGLLQNEYLPVLYVQKDILPDTVANWLQDVVDELEGQCFELE